MKTLNAICATALLIIGSGFAQAGDDIGPDKAVELLNAGTIKPFEQLNAAALAGHPDGVIGDTELEDVYGKYVYKVELRDAAGQEWDVDVDASTGAVLSDKQDD
jgi:uncharacterized membrane protein YkoI